MSKDKPIIKQMERRQERKNETLIMAKLNEIAVDIAVIKEKTGQLEDHAKTLNGKVYNMESRQQVIEGSVSANTRTISDLQKVNDRNASFWTANWKYIFTTLVMIIFALLGIRLK